MSVEEGREKKKGKRERARRGKTNTLDVLNYICKSHVNTAFVTGIETSNSLSLRKTRRERQHRPPIEQ